jgi:hypothetical protein
MKLSVKAKVANGLVVCLLLPRVANTAIDALEVEEGLSSFAADDDFDFSLRPGSLAIAKVENAQVTSDPSGGDPIGCDPSGIPAIHVNAPSMLTTSENGNTDSFEVFMDPPFPNTQYLYLSNPEASGGDPSGGDPSGGDPSGGLSAEALPVPEIIAIEAGSCAPHKIWVIGQNDGAVDGDVQFVVDIRDEYNNLFASVPGLNLDNDQNPNVTVEIFGPGSLAEGEEGQFTIRVANTADNDISSGRLDIEASSGVTILSYAASLMSGSVFQSTGRMTPDVLTFDDVELQAQDALFLSVNALLSFGSPGGENIIARFSNGQQTNDADESVQIPRP